jgi:Mg-chelatase subunit ChlI
MTFDSAFYNEEFITDNQGTFYELPFWFCSDECIIRALDTSVDKRFHYNRTAYNDPDLPDDHIEEFVKDWEMRRAIAYRQAFVTFRHRALGEYGAWVGKHNAEVDKEEERIRTALEKERRQLEADKQKKLDQAKKEEERQKRERERLEDRRLREEERLAKEEEKQRKLDEAEKARRAEEEKWKPRPFKL